MPRLEYSLAELRAMKPVEKPVEPEKPKVVELPDTSWIKAALAEIKSEVEELCDLKDQVAVIGESVSKIEIPQPLDFTDRLQDVKDSIAYVLSQMPQSDLLYQIEQKIENSSHRKWRHTILRANGDALSPIREVITEVIQ